tara:strand:+ start:13 stop:828 length:816 start_codon:yes stop_codon:yes gene_type:complete
MATVNLGKIKLKWRGTYNAGTAYTPDDVVYYADGSVGSSYICVTASTGNAPSSGGSAHSSWNYLAKGQATSPTTTQGDIIVRGASADGRLAIGAAGKVLKVNSGANGLEYGDGGKILQVVKAFGTSVYSSSNNNGNRRQQMTTSHGSSIVSLTITPQQAGSSTFYAFAQGCAGIGGNTQGLASLMHGSRVIGQAMGNGYSGDSGNFCINAFVSTSGLSGSQTFDFRNHGTRSGSTCYVNGNNSGQDANLSGSGYNGTNNSGVFIFVMEILD